MRRGDGGVGIPYLGALNAMSEWFQRGWVSRSSAIRVVHQIRARLGDKAYANVTAPQWKQAVVALEVKLAVLYAIEHDSSIDAATHESRIAHALANVLAPSERQGEVNLTTLVDGLHRIAELRPSIHGVALFRSAQHDLLTQLGQQKVRLTALHRRLHDSVLAQLRQGEARLTAPRRRLQDYGQSWWDMTGNRMLLNWRDSAPVVQFNPSLNDDDRRLANKWGWLRDEYDHGERALRLHSARRAEKSALDYFRQFSSDIQDVSMTQLYSDGKKEWRTHDLRVEGRAVDVKNLRGGSLGGYALSERPKNWRTVNVDICGVVSEGDGSKRQTVVGELSPRDLGALNKAIEQLAKQLCLPMSRHKQTINARWSNGVGAWLMEYKPPHYDRRNIEMTPKVLTMAGGMEKWMGTVPPWARGLVAFRQGHAYLYGDEYDGIISALAALHEASQVARPALFAFVVLFLLSEAKHGRWKRDITRKRIERVLFAPRLRKEKGDAWMYPVGLHDPLHIVLKAISMVDELVARNLSILESVVEIRLSGVASLRGRCEAGRLKDWFTLLAHCGDCGVSPLWAGDLKEMADMRKAVGVERQASSLCYDCLYLVCDRCSFCRQDCPSLKKRREVRY